MKISELRELADVVMKPGPAMPRTDDPKVNPGLPGIKPDASPLPIATNRSSPMPVRKFWQGGFWKGMLLSAVILGGIAMNWSFGYVVGYGRGLTSSQLQTTTSKGHAKKSKVTMSESFDEVCFKSENGELRYAFEKSDAKDAMKSYIMLCETMQGKLNDDDLLDLFLAVDVSGGRVISMDEAGNAYRTAQKKFVDQGNDKSYSALEQKIAEKESKIKEQEKKLAEYASALREKEQNYSGLELKVAEKDSKIKEQEKKLAEYASMIYATMFMGSNPDYSAFEQKISEQEVQIAQQNQEITALKAESQANIESMKCIIESKDKEIADYENKIKSLNTKLKTQNQPKETVTSVSERYDEVTFSNVHGELKFEYLKPYDADVKAAVTKYLFFCKSMQGELSGKQKLDLFLEMDKDGNFKISLEEAEEVLEAAREKYKSQAKPQQ